MAFLNRLKLEKKGKIAKTIVQSRKREIRAGKKRAIKG